MTTRWIRDVVETQQESQGIVNRLETKGLPAAEPIRQLLTAPQRHLAASRRQFQKGRSCCQDVIQCKLGLFVVISFRI